MPRHVTGFDRAALEPPVRSDTRRDFLAASCKLALGGVAAGFGLAALRMAVPAARRRGPPVALGAAGDFRVGTSTLVPSREVYVLHSPAGFAAISTRCPHLGCAVRATRDGFACPCHGARFDAQGAVQHGPARRALVWYALYVDERARLWLDRGREVPPGTFVTFALTPEPA